MSYLDDERTTSSVQGRSCAFEIARRSILDSQLAGGELASLLADRTLDHLWDGIFQYMVLRVGPERAGAMLDTLDRETADLDEGELNRDEAGPRAALYRRVRVLLSGSRLELGALQRAPWWLPHDLHHRNQLADLRNVLSGAFSAQELEVVELRFARKLDCDEVASVVAVEPSEAERVSRLALELTERLMGRRPRSHDRSAPGALLEAFALDTSRLPAPRRRRRRSVLSIGTVIAERYEIEARLGAGAFADVYRARDREVRDHVVALKILRLPASEPSAVRAAMRELQLIASVFHPSIVQLKDHGWHADRLWFVMPLYRGETLAQRLARGPLERREARAIFEPLAEGLAAMHRAGVLHQDIKPDNVFLAALDSDEHGARHVLPVLLDLGVATKDAELVLAGTPAYFAPEVAARFAGIADPPPIGPKADVFSLALTLRHALDPRPARDVMDGSVDAFVAYRATRAPAPPENSALADLRSSFARWLAFAPDARPSADDLQRELARLTLPEERRQRRMAALRWVAPSVIALLALFASVVYGLSREASLQRIEAAAARLRAEQAGERVARVSANLDAQQLRRRELEADVARLQSEYQNSRLTREQLAARLAQSQGELEALLEKQAKQQLDEQRKQRDERERASQQLAALKAARDELALKLDRSNGTIEAERAQRSSVEHDAQVLQRELDVARTAQAFAEARARELEARWAVWNLLTPRTEQAESRTPLHPATSTPAAATHEAKR